MRRQAKLLIVLAAQAVSLPLLLSQQATATLRGRVVDAEGAGLPNVVVSIASASSAFRVDARIEKSFAIGRVSASGFLNVENLLDSDDLTIHVYNVAAYDGAGLDAERRFGRRFEIGGSLAF